MALDVSLAAWQPVKSALNILREDAVHRTVTGRALQFIMWVREVKIKCNELIADIDGVGIETWDGQRALTGQRLAQQQNALAQVKTSLQNGGSDQRGQWGSVINLEVRNELVRLSPAYTDAAQIQTDIQASNTAFNNLSAEIESLLVVARAAGQLYDVHPTTGREAHILLTSPETDALRALAVTVRDSINGTV